MKTSIIASGEPSWGPRRYHQFQVMIPQSCQAESQKVTNLRNQISELESHLVEIDKMESWQEFLSIGKLSAGFVAESCMGFLDLAASILGAIPKMDGAKAVAESGLASIKMTKTWGAASTGQISSSQEIYQYTQAIMPLVPADTMASKALLKQVQTSVGAVGVAMKEQSGLEYVHSEASGTFNLFTDGMEKALGDNAKSVRVLKGLSALDGMISAASSYQDALDKILSERLEERMSNKQSALTMRMNTKKMIKVLQSQLLVAIENLNSCIAEANEPNMSVAR